MTQKERLRKFLRVLVLAVMIVSAINTAADLFWAWNNSRSVNDYLLPAIDAGVNSAVKDRRGEMVPDDTRVQLSVTFHQGLILLKDIPCLRNDCGRANRNFWIFLMSLLALKLINSKAPNQSAHITA